MAEGYDVDVGSFGFRPRIRGGKTHEEVLINKMLGDLRGEYGAPVTLEDLAYVCAYHALRECLPPDSPVNADAFRRLVLHRRGLILAEARRKTVMECAQKRLRSVLATHGGDQNVSAADSQNT